jgi:hypothetical protein
MKKTIKGILIVFISTLAVVGIVGAATTIGDQIVLTGTGTTGIDLSGATLSTSDITLQNGETISNSVDGTINLGAANLSNTGSIITTGALGAGTITGASTLTAGADAGNMYTSTLAAAGTYTGTTGHKFKVYDADGTVVHDGGEHTAVYANMKLLSAMASGGKSVLFSGHQHSSSTQAIDAGVWLYGNIVDAFKISGGTSTDGLDLSEQTITGADIKLSNGETITNTTDGVITIGAIMNVGSMLVAALPGACAPGSITNVSDSDDCSAGGGDGALCVCAAAGNAWSLLNNY